MRVLVIAAVLALAACATETDVADSSSAAVVVAETNSGTVSARAMLGLPATPSSDATLSDAEKAATKLIAKVESTQKGTLVNLGEALSSGDPAKATAAFVSTRNALVSAAPAPRAPNLDDIPVLGRGADGHFGDDRFGPEGAKEDAPDFVNPNALVRPGILFAIDAGTYKPDPESRLGAYAATAGYRAGTVGFGVHRAIGAIFLTFGNYGQERIGRVFNAPQAKALYEDPVDSASGYKMAQTELVYWNNIAIEDPWSAGGKLGSAFNAPVRNWIQITLGEN